MSQSAKINSTVEQLRDALSNGHVPVDLVSASQKLLGHLEKPTQITAIGKADAGKTSLLNMMLGSNCMPDLPDVQFIELVHGPNNRFICHGGETAEFDGQASSKIVPLGTTHVVQVAPLPTLADKTYVEVNLPKGEQARKDVLDWVVRNTSITLWCTQDFDTDEAALWSAFPDNLKDYAYLALTKADRLQMRGTLRQHAVRFQQEFADEFLCMYPVATKRALAARQSGAVIDDKLWAASGGKALVEGLQQQIENGRSADLDHANLLLQKIGRPAKGKKATADTSPQQPAVATLATPRKEKQPLLPEGRAVKSQSTRDIVLKSALELLEQNAGDMLNTYGQSPAANVAHILDHTTQTAQALSTILADTAVQDPLVNTLQENVLESQQVILLLQLEGTENAACDAVTALLQLKKEISEMAVAC